MNTIDLIIIQNWYTKEQLLDCEKKGICNWMWSKGGIQWTDELRKFKYFQKWKMKKLLFDLDLISNIHDIMIWESKNFKEFINANYILANNVIQLLHWTWFLRKIVVWLWIFWATTFFWYFNSKDKTLDIKVTKKYGKFKK